MLKRKIFALMCLVATLEPSINAQNDEGKKEEMRIVVNNADFSVNTDLTSYFDGQTPTPIEHNENYDSYYVTPVAGKTMSYPLEFQFDARNYSGKAFLFKEHCYIMKIDSNYIEPPYFITRYSFPGNLFIDCVAIEDATGDTITNNKITDNLGTLRVSIKLDKKYFGKLIRLDITTYGMFPESSNGLKQFTIRPTFNEFSNYFKLAYEIPDTEYNIYTSVYNQSAKPEGNEFVTVYDATGHVIRTNIEKASSLDGLKSGIYIVNGKKVMVNNK